MAFRTGLRNPAIVPAAYEEEQQPRGEFEKAVERGLRGFGPSIDRTQAAFQAAVGLEDQARANLAEAQAAEQEIAQRNLAPAVGRVEDVYQPDDLAGTIRRGGQYAASVLGENLPLLGSMAVGGLAGGVAGRTLAGRGLAPKVGGTLGAAAPYEATSVGEVARDIMTPEARGTLQEQGLGALGYGTAKTVLGMTPFGVGARMLRGPGGRLARGAKVGGASALTEGLTEAGEEAIGQYAETQFIPGAEMLSDEALSDYLNAAVGGALLGGVTGGAAGVLAPRGLQRSMEHSMQSAVEDGRSPFEGASDWLKDNGDLLSDEELANLGPEIENFQPQAPRGQLARRIAQREADDELSIAFSNVLGMSDEDYAALETRERKAADRRRKKAEKRRQEIQARRREEFDVRDIPLERKMAGDVQDDVYRTAYALIKGEITQEQAEQRWPAQRLKDAVRDLTQRFGPETSGDLGRKPPDPEEQQQLDIQETRAQFLFNKKGLPWHVSEKDQAEKVAREHVMDAMTAAQRNEYKNATGKDREKLDKMIEESRPRRVSLRTLLLREASDLGITDVNDYMLGRIEGEILPAYRQANPGTKQHDVYMEYRNRPAAMLDTFGVLAKEDIPRIFDKYGVDTVKPEQLRAKREGDTKTEQDIRRLTSDIDELQAGYDAYVFGDEGTKQAYQDYRDRAKRNIQTTPEQREQFFGVAAREAEEGMQELASKLSEMRLERGRLKYKREGIITARSKKPRQDRIPVEEYDVNQGKWIARELNPMAAANAAFGEVAFDPDASKDVVMRQIVEGLGAVLGSQMLEGRAGKIAGDPGAFVGAEFKGFSREESTAAQQAIRLPIEINPETIVYRRKQKPGMTEEDRTIKWGDVIQWMADRTEKKTYEPEEKEQEIVGDEGPDNLEQETKPLKSYKKEGHTLPGDLPKEPGPYVYDVFEVKPLTAAEQPKQVISGGQTGADIGGLVGAQSIGIPTGGFAPKGYRTDVGDKPELGERFGLKQATQRGYPQRTEMNVKEADVTLIFRPEGHESPGTEQTIRFARKHKKPYRVVDPFVEGAVEKVIDFVRKHKPEIVNIAGPREKSVKGMGQQTAYVVASALNTPDVVTRGAKDTAPPKAKPKRDLAPEVLKKPKLVGPKQLPIDEQRREAAAKRKKLREDLEKGKKQAQQRREKARAEAKERKAKRVKPEKKAVDVKKPLTAKEAEAMARLGRKPESRYENLIADKKKKLDFSSIPKDDRTTVDKIIDRENPVRIKRHQRYVDGMTKKLGLSNIRVVNTREAVSIMVAFGQGDSIARKNGFLATRGGETLMYVNPTLAEAAALEVVGHELGHAVLNETWSKAPKKVKQAVQAEFKAYLKRIGTDPSVYKVISERTPHKLLSHSIWQDFSLDDKKLSDQPKADQEYLLHFDEWFSDNVAKWTVTDAKPRSLIDQFFKHVADLIKDLWSSLVRSENTPEKSVQAYMDRIFEAEPEKNYAFKFPFGFSEVPAGASSIHGANWSVSGDESQIRQAMQEFLTGEELNVLGLEAHRNHIRNQMLEFYRGDTVALDHINESRTAEMTVLLYKAWRAGAVKVRRKPESIFVKLMQKAAELLGIIMNDKNAVKLMEDISRGAVTERIENRKTYTQSRMNETGLQQARDVIERMSAPALNWAVKIGGTAEMRVRWAKNAALTEMWKQVYLSPDTAGGREGFFAAVRRSRAYFERKMHDIYDGEDAAMGERVVKFLNKELDMSEATPEERKVVGKTYSLLREIYTFTKRAGVKMGDRGSRYFPRVYDMDVLVKNRDEFIEMLTTNYEKELQEYYNGLYKREAEAPVTAKTPKEIAEFIHRNLTTQQGDELSAIEQIQREVDEDPLGWPAISAAKERSLGWIKDEDIATYLSQDLGLTLSTYIYQSAKRAEYNRRFGVGTGKKLVTNYIDEAKALGASEDDVAMAENVMKAALGTLGADINPTLHKWQGIIMVLENWMLLGLATLTSLVDPMGIAVRGDLDTAWQSLAQGMKEVKAKMKGDQTELSKMAGLLGINELHNTVEALGYEYGGYYVTGAARRWNERLFSINLLTQWTRVTRTMALAGARRFLAKHREMDSEKSRRFMQELGIREGDIQVDDTGNVVIMDDVERRALENFTEEAWDDPNLAKHYPTGIEGKRPSSEEVLGRFSEVNWQEAPISVVRAVLLQKNNKMQAYLQSASNTRSQIFGMDAAEAEDQLYKAERQMEIAQNIERERDILLDELHRRNDSKDARAIAKLAQQAKENAQFLKAEWENGKYGRNESYMENEYKDDIREIEYRLEKGDYTAAQAEKEKKDSKARYTKRIKKAKENDAYWSANGERLYKEAAAKAAEAEKKSRKFDEGHGIDREGGISEDKLKLEKDERVRQALNRWVDEAILRPDAAQRPIWASDPHWMLVFHLKAFTYSFHERILRRVGHEIMNGNYQPVIMLMGYLPLMYAAEALRNGLQGDDDWEPDGFFETTHHLAQRSGLYGIGQFYFDVKDGWRYGDTPFSVLGGPSVEHALSIGEAALTASEADDERALVRSMPFHNLWKEWYE